MADKSLKELNQERLIQKDILDTILKQAQSDKERIAIKKNLAEADEKTREAYRDALDSLREINEQVKSIKAENKSKVTDLANEASALKGLTGLQSSLVQFEQQKIQSLAAMPGLNENVRESVQSISDLNQELLKTSSEDVIQRALLNKQLDAEFENLKGARGVHAQLKALMQKERDMAEGISNMTEKQQVFLDKQLAVYEGIRDTIGGVLETASLLTSTVGGVLGSALIGAGYAAEALGKNVREFGGTMSGAVYSTTLLGTVFDDATGTAKGLAKEFGGMEDVSFGTQLNTNLMATNMGISGDEASKTLGIFSRLNSNSKDTAFNMADSVASMSRASGLDTSQVMGDIAANAESFAEYSQDGGKNMGLAAIQAAKLGVSMGTLTNVTDSLLDFETSITKELELGAMLGKNINLNRARGLAYEGKVGASVKETIKQLGGVEEYNKMDIFAKRETAKLLGINQEELSKLVNNMENLNDDGTLQLSTWGSITESVKAFATGPMGSVLQSLGSAVIAVGQMGDGLGVLKDVFPGISKGLGGMWDKMKGFASSTWAAVKGLFQQQAITTTMGATDIASEVGGSIAENVTPEITTPNTSEISSGPSIGDKLKDLAGGLKEMGNAKVLFGALNLIPTALGFVAMLPGIPGMALLGLVAPSVSAGLNILGPSLKMFGQTVKGALPEIGIGLLVLAAFGAAMIPLAFALGLAAPAISAFGDVILSVFKGIGSVIESIGIAIGSVIGSVATGFTTLFDSITLEKVAAIGLLSLAFMGLAGSLMFLGTAGILALPALLGIAAASTGLSMVASIFGIGGDSGGENSAVEKGSLSEYEETMLEKMDSLISAVSANKDVYLDKDRVTSLVMQKSDRSILNKLNIFNA
jgi:hypothetical protein